jgi:hypothetical protein
MILLAECVTLDEINGALARGYCAEGCSDKVVDPTLIEAMACEVAALGFNCTQPTSDNTDMLKFADYLEKYALDKLNCDDSDSAWCRGVLWASNFIRSGKLQHV